MLDSHIAKSGIGDIGNKGGIIDRQIRTEIGEWWRFF